uniref:Uncharacterized protein n=1 Tax=Mimiviridae sp. ChoanoV1 TaxID=2596887 RepID=A0A5B8HWD6_9VIRU|nr:hypothetical protein 8_16 [Mimiviridae sp. ChoanoV1]
MENYFLKNDSSNEELEKNMMNDINNNLIRFLNNDNNELQNKNAGEKGLELESLIIDALARNDNKQANKLFQILENMYDKYNDDRIRDIYFRVLDAMPKEENKKNNKGDIYSYRQNKNNFKDILTEMHKEENIKPFNEDNECISSLGLMWDECDRNICSAKCKDKIKKATDLSLKKECGKIVTGVKKNKNDEDVSITMTDDIKDVILERLKYCSQLSKIKNSDLDELTYRNKHELKQKLIDEIYKFSRLANIHYSNCSTNAANFLKTDEKYKQILSILKTIDLSKLNIPKLEMIRNDLTKLPNCSNIAYENYEKNRNENLKDGIKVGDYIIPKNTNYYNELKGKDKPLIYKDLVTDKQYFYDKYSKSLTPIEIPVKKSNDMEITKKIDSPPGPSDLDLNNEINKIIYSPSMSNLDVELDNIGKKMVEEHNNIINRKNNNMNNMNNSNNMNYSNNMNNIENSIKIYGLSVKNIVEYIALILAIVIIVYVSSIMFDQIKK